ncbi:MAG: acylneuraminate cytidylyltransferase family protein, partial [Christiangramia sp.]|nr:acylneuraminate cytidylyltransferase family protein [Christiangramia sp.]
MILAVIPARGGSKGVPGKNIKRLGEIPLIEYTVRAARQVFSDDQIIVSTDDPDIKKTAEAAGLKVPFLRPPELANDTAGTQEVLLHALDFAISQGKTPEVIVLLQPTSPFREARHIKEALKLYDRDIEMVVSVKETDANPYYVLKE